MGPRTLPVAALVLAGFWVLMTGGVGCLCPVLLALLRVRLLVETECLVAGALPDPLILYCVLGRELRLTKYPVRRTQVLGGFMLTIQGMLRYGINYEWDGVTLHH